jgi:predicted  nucleic acid-binding Zn-ribbon protein
MLERWKDRLEKEIHTLDKRRGTAERQLDSINKQIENLRKETHDKERIKTYRSIPTKPLKTMAINY